MGMLSVNVVAVGFKRVQAQEIWKDQLVSGLRGPLCSLEESASLTSTEPYP